MDLHFISSLKKVVIDNTQKVRVGNNAAVYVLGQDGVESVVASVRNTVFDMFTPDNKT